MSMSSGRFAFSCVLLAVLCLGAVSAQNWYTPVGKSTHPKPVAPRYVTQIQTLINFMTNRWQTLDSACDPNAVFALTYLYMTHGLHYNVARGYFDDGEVMSNFTLNFASRYSTAFTTYFHDQSTGAHDYVTPPWVETFSYADSGYSSAEENLVQGMNAHINLDLAQIVYNMSYGIPANKPDYDRINDILYNMTAPVNNALAARYDPSFYTSAPLDQTILEALIQWRENAWQNGVALMNAPNATAFNAIETNIMTQAIAGAKSQESYNAAGGFQPTSPTRVAYCSANHWPLYIPEPTN